MGVTHWAHQACVHELALEGHVAHGLQLSASVLVHNVYVDTQVTLPPPFPTYTTSCLLLLVLPIGAHV